jgi:hypothetical protein
VSHGGGSGYYEKGQAIMLILQIAIGVLIGNFLCEWLIERVVAAKPPQHRLRLSERPVVLKTYLMRFAPGSAFKILSQVTSDEGN